jgi:acyl carrier protein
MKDTQSIRKKIREYIVGATFAEKENIRDNSLLFKEGYFDSMGFMLLVTFIKEEFGTKTSDVDLIEENFESIDAITDFVVRKSL